MKKLSAIALSLSIILFANNAIAFDDPNGHFTKDKIGDTTDNYKKITDETKKSRMGRIVGNIKKIAKPNLINVGVTVGVVLLIT